MSFPYILYDVFRLMTMRSFIRISHKYPISAKNTVKLSTELRRWWAIIRRKTRALYIYSGSRPVLGVFHEIRCHQANIRTFIRKDSNHAGTSVDFTIQSFNHVGRWDFSRVQHGECIEGQRIFQSIFKALNRFRQALGIGVDHIICAIISLRLFSSTPHTISTAMLIILPSTRTFSYSASTQRTEYTVSEESDYGTPRPTHSVLLSSRWSGFWIDFRCRGYVPASPFFRVETPCTKASCTTCTSISSLRLRSVTKNGM